MFALGRVSEPGLLLFRSQAGGTSLPVEVFKSPFMSHPCPLNGTWATLLLNQDLLPATDEHQLPACRARPGFRARAGSHKQELGTAWLAY